MNNLANNPQAANECAQEGIVAAFNKLSMDRIQELTKKYKLPPYPNPNGIVLMEQNGAIIEILYQADLQRIITSISRTEEEKARLRTNDKFGAVVPISALILFEEAILEIVPGARWYRVNKDPYVLIFNGTYLVQLFYLLMDKVDKNLDILTRIILPESSK